MSTFYTSDHHFMFAPMIDFADRPYKSASAMGADMINKWNMMVKKDDVVYYLGDFSTHNEHKVRLMTIFEQLNGRKHLIVGNHDDATVQRLPWKSVSMYDTVRPESETPMVVHMSHYPPKPQERDDNRLYLHGHLHTKGPSDFPSYDVGVDANYFAPVHESIIVKKAEAYLKRRREGFGRLRGMMNGAEL